MIGLSWRYRGSCAGVVALHILIVALSLSGLGLTGIGIDLIGHHLNPPADHHGLPCGARIRRSMAGPPPTRADCRLDPRVSR